MLPRVSVVLPTYNRCKDVQVAVQSVLDQDYPQELIEIIVVDDGGADDTIPVLRARWGDRLRLERKVNGGVSSARNHGARLATGEILAFLDSDDWWRPTKLTRQVEVLKADPRCVAVLTDLEVIDANLGDAAEPVIRRNTQYEDGALSLARLVRFPDLGPSCMIMTARAYQDFGGFDESLPTAEDIDLLLRLAAKHTILNVDEQLTVTYRHPTGGGGLSNMARTTRDFVGVIERFIATHDLPPPVAHAALFTTYLRNARTSMWGGEIRFALELTAKSAAHIRGAGDAREFLKVSTTMSRAFAGHMKAGLKRTLGLATVLAIALGLPALADAKTWQVGPKRDHRQLVDVAGEVQPGDVIEVDGDATYAAIELKASGTKAAPILWKGLRGKSGARPVLRGGDVTVLFKGDYNTLAGFEITGGDEVCVFNKAHGTIVRDARIHGCRKHGVLGADDEAGSLTLSYVEVCDSGGERKGEKLKHPIYIATDEKKHPDAVFRLEHSWVHGNNGGNSVKSRARRTELYYNWLEGAQYYEAELIGPEDKTGRGGLREDSDVVGNVIVATSDAYAVRLGGDGAGASEGRVRFVNNTFILGKASRGVLRLHDFLESIEMYNNVFVHTGAWGSQEFLRDMEVTWVSGRKIRGANNFTSHDPKKIPNFPRELLDTRYGADACFEDVAALDLRPKDGSPLADAGTDETTSEWSPADALAKPEWVPPRNVLEAPAQAWTRKAVGALDLGAYELGSSVGALGNHAAFVDDAPRRDARCGKPKLYRGGVAGGVPAPTSNHVKLLGLIGGGVAVVVATVMVFVGIRKSKQHQPQGGRA